MRLIRSASQSKKMGFLCQKTAHFPFLNQSSRCANPIEILRSLTVRGWKEFLRRLRQRVKIHNGLRQSKAVFDKLSKRSRVWRFDHSHAGLRCVQWKQWEG